MRTNRKDNALPLNTTPTVQHMNECQLVKHHDNYHSGNPV
jgi:hypothetical protein